MIRIEMKWILKSVNNNNNKIYARQVVEEKPTRFPGKFIANRRSEPEPTTTISFLPD